MGYAKEKKEIEGKIKRIKRIILCVVAGLVVLLCVFAYFYKASEWKYKTNLPAVTARKAGDMRVHFLSVGHADATLIEFPDGQTMLVDCGDGKDLSVRSLLRYFQALKINTVDYFVLTYAEYGRYGGAFDFLEINKIKNAYLPYGQELVNEGYAELYDKLGEKGVQRFSTGRDVKISVEGCTVAFLYPRDLDVENSVASLWLDYAGTSILLAGRMNKDTQDLCMEEDVLGGFTVHGVALKETEIVKLPNHGGTSCISDTFLEYLHAEKAVVSCGGEGSFVYPTKDTLDLLTEKEIPLYRTDTQGHICVTIGSDGTYSVQTIKRT